ncbi:MAG: hypothetical protein ABW139_06665 [Candidatus Thiodiazotropha sp. DIVDIV]
MTYFSSVALLSLISVGITLSVVLSLRFLHFPDLTIDGTVATSGGVFAVVLVNTHSTALAIVIAALAGFLCGIATMFLHERLGIGKLLAGILVFTALYSVDLHIMGGSNVAILGEHSWFDALDQAEGHILGKELARFDPLKILSLVLLMGAVLFGLYRFYHARPGIVIRGIGDNERAISRLAISTSAYKYLGLGLANAVAGLCAALVVMNQGFADVGMGLGSLVLGLASLIIGEKIVGLFWGSRDLVLGLVLSALVGTILYQALWLLVLRLGVPPTDLKLFTMLLVVFTYVWGKRKISFYEGRAF